MPAEIPSVLRRLREPLAGHFLSALLTAATLLCPLAGQASDRMLGTLQDVLLPAQRTPGSARYFTTSTGGGQHRIRTEFLSHDGDPLALSFTIEPAASRASMQAFGVSAEDLEALRQACIRTGSCDQAEFEHRLQQYYREHKLRLRSVPGQRPRLFVDIPAVVRHNRAQVRPVATALRQLGDEHGGDADWIFDAAVALVQSGLAYRRPAAEDGGRQTLGFYTPPRALEKGYGDCDTKSALLAAVLLDLGAPRIIGVHIPEHYLLGIARPPRPGEAYLEYAGEPFVLVEAAGPAQRRPGDVATRTRAALDAGAGIRIDPMF